MDREQQTRNLTAKENDSSDASTTTTITTTTAAVLTSVNLLSTKEHRNKAH
jgi:hypothetical protein